jgi:hypothetical protein
MPLTSKERGDRVATKFLPGSAYGTREHLAALVKREVDESVAVAIGLVQQMLPKVDSRIHGGSRELFAAATEFLAAHGVR